MADEELNVKIQVDGAKQAASEVTGVTGAFRGLSSAVTGLNQGIELIKKFGSAVKDAADKVEDINNAYKRFNGNIDTVQKRVNGLISDLDLMQASNAAAARGLNLTSEELADVAVKANEFSEQAGGNATERLNELIEALSRGREEGLRKFGIQADNTKEALNELSNQFGKTSLKADSFADRIEQAMNRAENATNKFVNIISESGPLQKALDRLTASAPDAFGGISRAIEDEFIRAAATVTALAEAIADLMEGVKEGNISKVLNSVNLASFVERSANAARAQRADIDAAAANPSVEADIQGHRTTPTRSGGRGRGGRAPVDGISNADASFQYPSTGSFAGNPANGETYDVAGARRDRLGQEAGAAVGAQDLANFDPSSVGGNSLTSRIREQNAALEEQSQVVQELMGAYNQLGGAIASGLVNGIEQAIKGHQNLGKAIVRGIKEELYGVAKREAVLALASGAAALGALAIPGGEKAAASYGAAAAGHAAAAAAAGAGAAALSQITLGSGGGGGGSTGGATRPARDASASSSTGGGTTVIINWNSGAILAGTYADAGRMIERALQASQQRYG